MIRSSSSRSPASSSDGSRPTPPLVSLVIPHVRGKRVLCACLESLRRHTRYPRYEVILVDNGSGDGSVEAAGTLLSGIRVLRLEQNRGYTGGCNHGIRHAGGKYVVLLNDDTELTPGWLEALVDTAESSEQIAACQSKLLSLEDRCSFEYSGAAGGLMDVFAFPFSWGRLFDVCEPDHGQYDQKRDIFWGGGAALLLRRSALEHVGLLDETFFSYMEEIDLCWRMQLAGFRIVYVPQSRVYHLGGYTSATRDFLKMYFNHRNSVIMLIKNYSLLTLLWTLPGRLALEMLAVVTSPVRNPLRSLAVIKSMAWVVLHPGYLIHRHLEVRRIRKVPDRTIFRRLYLGSTALEYFLFGKQKVNQLFGYPRLKRLMDVMDSPAPRVGGR